MISHHPDRHGVEVLCIGTELLLGNIINSNARWLAEQLAAMGIPHFRQQVVGDNRERLMKAVREAAERSRILITTGGLGPTPDDLTSEAIASAFGVPLVHHPEVWRDIETKIGARQSKVAPNNRRQALLPLGAQVLPNPTGTAPGMIWSPVAGFTVLTFPGVPSELKAMWAATAAAWLEGAGLAEGVFVSRMMRSWGLAESVLADQVSDLLALVNPTVAPYAGAGEVMLRITARGTDAQQAWSLLSPVEGDLRARLGSFYFGCDEDTLASVVLECLRARRETIAVAESCTGGGIGAALAAIAGASEAFLGGVIAYANAVKIRQLGVPADLIERHGAVSDQVAVAMAEGVRKLTGATWAIAVTGIAGPGGGSKEKPVGQVHIALAGPDGSRSRPFHANASRGRGWIQTLTTGEGLNRLRLRLEEAGG